MVLKPLENINVYVVVVVVDVGSRLGSKDGAKVGFRVGCKDGAKVGFRVGCKVGAEVVTLNESGGG